jgi:hypothetical protein
LTRHKKRVKNGLVRVHFLSFLPNFNQLAATWSRPKPDINLDGDDPLGPENGQKKGEKRHGTRGDPKVNVSRVSLLHGILGVTMRQASLLDLLPHNPDEPVGLVSVMPAVRAEMNRAAGNDEQGRKLLVDAINKVARREAVALSAGGAKSVTIDTLNKWLQPSERGHAPSLEAILCFCLATGDIGPMRPIMKALRITAITAEDVEVLEYGRTCRDMRKLKTKKTMLEGKL